MAEVLKIGVVGGGGWLGGAIVESILRAGLAMNLLLSTAQGRSDIISMTRQDVPDNYLAATGTVGHLVPEDRERINIVQHAGDR